MGKTIFQEEVLYGKMNPSSECWYLYMKPPRLVPCPKIVSFFTEACSAKVKNDLVEGQGTDLGGLTYGYHGGSFYHRKLLPEQTFLLCCIYG